MPQQDLPEGTDTVIAGASKSDTGGGGGSGGAGAGSGGGIVGKGSGAGGGGSSGGSGGGSGGSGGLGADKIVGQVRDQVYGLRDQATEKARGYAEGGKDRTTQLLDDIAEIIHDAARSIDDRLGDQYGEYAHKAGDAVLGLSGNLREKSLEDLIEGTRSIVRKSPAVTVGTAALLGFVLVRLVKSGLEGGEGGTTGGNRTGTTSAGGTSSGAGSTGAGA
ncbi:MAG TPA: hypothetical protein VGB79_02225 [Allosphingosinicella sp.]|jgi:ElaB/YqjD/DUF883 family membrane-anchored ribosome-binding protein